jgi:hypothetical protein
VPTNNPQYGNSPGEKIKLQAFPKRFTSQELFCRSSVRLLTNRPQWVEKDEVLTALIPCQRRCNGLQTSCISESRPSPLGCWRPCSRSSCQFPLGWPEEGSLQHTTVVTILQEVKWSMYEVQNHGLLLSKHDFSWSGMRGDAI